MVCERAINEEELLYKKELLDVLQKATFNNVKFTKKQESQKTSIVNKGTLTDGQAREKTKLCSKKGNASEDAKERWFGVPCSQGYHARVSS